MSDNARDFVRDLEWQIAVVQDKIAEFGIKLKQLEERLAALVSQYQIGDIIEKVEGYRSGKFVVEGFGLGPKIGNSYGSYLRVAKLKKDGKKSKVKLEIYIGFCDDEYSKIGVYNEQQELDVLEHKGEKRE